MPTLWAKVKQALTKRRAPVVSRVSSASEVEMVDVSPKGPTAIARVLEQIPSDDTMAELIHAKSPNADVTSCAMTVSVLADILSDKPISPIQDFGRQSPPQRVATIARLLNEPNMVAVSISPDHHFIFVPTDADHVSILQAFQGSYSFPQWVQAGGDVAIPKAELVEAVTHLATGTETEKRAAAVRLFSYRSPAAQTAEGLKVERDIHEWFDNKSIVITQVAYKVL